MVDKITLSKEQGGQTDRRLDDEDVVRLNRAVVVFLGWLARAKRCGKRARRS